MSSLGGSSAGGSDDPSTVEIGGPKPGQDDSGEFSDDSRAFSQGLFGVLYTVSKEKAPGWKWAGFRLFVDALQLWLILVSPAYGYTGWITPENKLWQVVSLINLTQFLAARGYTFFVLLMYIMVVGLMMAVGLCVWVGYSFQNNRFDHVWPIVFLRIYSVVFFQVLDIASMTLFLVALDCQMSFTPSESSGIHQEFPDVKCWQMPHMIHAGVAVVSLLLFTTMAGFFTMSEMELNPLSNNPLAMAHSKVEVISFGIKFVMTAASTLVVHLKWLSVIQSAAALWLLCIYWKWIPHMRDVVNNIRVGTYAMTFYCAVMLLFLGFLPGIDADNPEAVYSFQKIITYVMWAGLMPSFAAGYFATKRRQNWFKITVVQRFQDVPVDAKPQSIYKFTDVREVEILGRCCRAWLEEDVLDDQEVKLAEAIMKSGMAQLSNNAFMIILLSSFLIEVQSSYQSGYSILQLAKKNDPSLLERFALFAREQQHAQKSSGAQPGQATDLVSYVEFQRNYRLVLKVHKEALAAVKSFWACLLQRKVKFDAMSACVDRIELAVKQAERVYRNVLQRHANNMKVVRLYSKFLENVKHDPWGAAKWSAEAEKLELLAEESKASNVFEDMEVMDPALRHSLQAMGPMSDTRAIVVINAQCMVQATNQAACDMFGFLRNELVGRNVSQIIPAPFADHHNQYVRTYLNTGKAQMLNRMNNFVALHKDRYVVPISLHVSKVSGIGEDTMFLGLLEASRASAQVAYVWVLFNNQLMCVDPVFSDWFAFRNDEVVGTQLSAYVVDSKRLDETLRNARLSRALHASQSRKDVSIHRGGSSTGPKSPTQQEWQAPGMQMAHKYADPVVVDITITCGNVGTHKFTCLAIKRAVPKGSKAADTGREMLVSDRKGRLLHMTQGLAAALGSTPRNLMANDMTHALEGLMTQPFAQLHKTLAASIPSHTPPPYSCRSGLSVLLCSMGPQGPDAAPFRMHIKLKRQGAEQNVWHVATMEKRTLAQALQERCMTLILDVRGYVLDAAVDQNASPFGIKPSTLLGLHISSFVDIMSSKGPGAAGLKPSPPTATGLDMQGAVARRPAPRKSGEKNALPRSLSNPWDDDTAAALGYVSSEDEGTVAAVLMELATKYLVALRSVPPSGVTKAPQNLSQQAVAALLGRMQAKPGMISVGLMLDHVETPPHSPVHHAERSHRASGSKEVDMFEGLMGRSHPSNGSLASFTSTHDDKGRATRMGSPDTQYMRRKSMVSAMGDIDTIQFQVKLWRTKFSSSVIEVDSAGRVMGQNPEDKVQKLYPAGLILGAPNDQLHGQSISNLIPIGARGVRALLDVEENGKTKKSLLKAQSSDERVPGPVHLMVSKHLGDGQDVQFTVQAIPKLGRSTNCFLLLHAHEPKGGRPGFASWVMNGGLRPPGGQDQEVDMYREKQLNKTRRASALSLDKALSLPGGPPLPRVGSAGGMGLATAMAKVPIPPSVAPQPQASYNIDEEVVALGPGPWDAVTDGPSVKAKAVATASASRGPSMELDTMRTSPQDAAALATAAQNPRIVRWVAASSEAAAPMDVDAVDGDADAPESAERDEGEEEEEDDKSDRFSDHQGSDNQMDADREEANRNADSGTDYRRGRRYKKLMRVLSSALMQRNTITFKKHTIGVVVALLVAHVAVFAIMFMLLSSQAVGVADLNNAGLAIRYAGEMGLATRQLQQLYEPIPVSSPVKLTGLTDANDIPPLREWYRQNLDKFKAKHAAFYLGADSSGRRVPNVNGLRAIWETNVLVQDVVYAIPWNESIDFNATNIYLKGNVSLWDLGNAIYSAGNQIYTNADWRIKNYGLISTWHYFEYLMKNMPNVLAENYYTTMDSMVDFVLAGAKQVNQVQTLLLAVEGCVLCCLAIVYVWYLATKVAAQRFNVFNVFLAIPFGLARNLATRKNDLDEEDEDEDESMPQDGGANAQHATNNPLPEKAATTDAAFGNKSGAVSLFVRQTAPGAAAASAKLTPYQRCLEAMKCWSSSKPASLGSSKRQLVQSYRQTLLLTWPFLFWGCTIIATYAIGVSQLAQISGPIATFNMVNFVAVRTHLFFFELQELVIEFDQTNMDKIRVRVAERLSYLVKDYTAMMYGGQALPNETTPHFTLATLGLTYTGGKAADVLFTTTACLCEDPKDCKEDKTNPYYDDTHNGLARLMTAFIKNSDAVSYMHGLDPWLFGPEFAWFWYVRFDILGGLGRLNQYYQSYVVSVYGNVIKIHIAALVLTCIIMVSFLLLVLRPFINKTSYETRRVAELLSQLPPDVDVEALIVKALPRRPGLAPDVAVISAPPALPSMKAMDGPPVAGPGGNRGSMNMNRGQSFGSND